MKSADQAQPVVQLTFLPLSFISGIWFPLDGAPDWLVPVAHVFPLYHLVQAFGGAFTPAAAGSRAPRRAGGVDGGGLVIAVRRFRWERRPSSRCPDRPNISARVRWCAGD